MPSYREPAQDNVTFTASETKDPAEDNINFTLNEAAVTTQQPTGPVPIGDIGNI